MSSSDYVRVLRSWLWLLLVAGFVGGGIFFISADQQVPTYVAETLVSIGQAYQDPNPSPDQLYVGPNLVATYQNIVETHDVLQGVVDALKLKMPPEELGALVNTSIVENTSLLKISVTYLDPILAAEIANGIATQLIAYSPTSPASDQQQQIDLVKSQISALAQQVADARTRIAQIDQILAGTAGPSTKTELTLERTSLLDQVNQASAAIAQFQTTLSTNQFESNVVKVVDPAIIPTVPGNIDTGIYTLYGAVGGVGIAIAVVLVLDHFNDKIRTVEDASRIVSMPVLGAIPRFGKRKIVPSARLITNYESLSEVAEAYRRLRTNLVFMTEENRQKVVVVTSSGPGEGKSVTSANLAVTMASAGMSVLLIDADMRRPMLHLTFGLKNIVGLSTLLFADPSNANYGTSHGQGIELLGHDNPSLAILDQCMQTTQVANLKVITSGLTPANPSEILGSVSMKQWIEILRTASNIDIIVIDTPPTLMFADSSVLASLINSDVLLIVDSTKTRTKAVIQSCERLEQVGLTVKGIVLNCFNARDDTSYYGSYYGSYYAQGSKPQRSGFLRIFGR